MSEAVFEDSEERSVVLAIFVEGDCAEVVGVDRYATAVALPTDIRFTLVVAAIRELGPCLKASHHQLGLFLRWLSEIGCG